MRNRRLIRIFLFEKYIKFSLLIDDILSGLLLGRIKSDRKRVKSVGSDKTNKKESESSLDDLNKAVPMSLSMDESKY